MPAGRVFASTWRLWADTDRQALEDLARLIWQARALGGERPGGHRASSSTEADDSKGSEGGCEAR